ncbi:MAG TPA: isoprenylcysteine carboxylmethyltransferase family protein [Acidobacteriaceae bacterium]|nr:isoprenylcysteine carboxylmethyltransferase family protein [Acidobacteriaceae bacterium]
MQATEFEFKYRLWIGFAIYIIGFWAPWSRYSGAIFPASSTWLELSGELSRLFPLDTATVIVTLTAIFLAALGTFLRVWGTAYIGGSVVQSKRMHAQGVLAVGPYRYLRNPLYFGSFLFLLAMAVLMPPSGAIFAVVVTGVQLTRVILREENFLAAQQGEVYLAYKSRVPRFFPSPMPRLPKAPLLAHWAQAFPAESFQLTMTACFAIFAWRYNAQLLIQALLVCFGISLVVRAVAVKPA